MTGEVMEHPVYGSVREDVHDNTCDGLIGILSASEKDNATTAGELLAIITNFSAAALFQVIKTAPRQHQVGIYNRALGLIKESLEVLIVNEEIITAGNKDKVQ